MQQYLYHRYVKWILCSNYNKRYQQLYFKNLIFRLLHGNVTINHYNINADIDIYIPIGIKISCNIL